MSHCDCASCYTIKILFIALIIFGIAMFLGYFISSEIKKENKLNDEAIKFCKDNGYDIYKDKLEDRTWNKYCIKIINNSIINKKFIYSREYGKYYWEETIVGN